MAGTYFMLPVILTGSQIQRCDKHYHSSTKMS